MGVRKDRRRKERKKEGRGLGRVPASAEGKGSILPGKEKGQGYG
jgi:hypothetical protein